MLRRYLAAGLLACLLCFAVAPSGAGEILSDEDVVRLHVRGMPADELIRTIRQSEVDFDLSAEMLEELRIAGIPAAILDAMRERQVELEPVATAAESPAVPSAARLVVELNPERGADKDPPLVQALDSVDRKLSEALGLRAGEPTITDLGIALYCRTPDHVPDHWRSKSPIGRDFNIARHRMLVYVSGASSEPASSFRDSLSKLTRAQVWRESMSDLQVLTLEVPRRLSIELEPGVAHDLSLALTIRIGGRSYVALFDQLDAVVLDETGDTTIRAELRSRSKDPLKALVEFRDPTDE